MKQLDTDLGGAVNDMAMILGVVQMRMQQRTYESVEKIADAMESSKANGGESDAEAMAQAVAQAAGMSREDASQELGDLKNVSVFFTLCISLCQFKCSPACLQYSMRLSQAEKSQEDVISC